MEIIAGEK